MVDALLYYNSKYIKMMNSFLTAFLKDNIQGVPSYDSRNEDPLGSFTFGCPRRTTFPSGTFTDSSKWRTSHCFSDLVKNSGRFSTEQKKESNNIHKEHNSQKPTIQVVE